MAATPSRFPLLLSLPLSLCLTACTLYLGGDPDGDDFADDYERGDGDGDGDGDGEECTNFGAPAVPALSLRDPQSGQCQTFSGGGTCDPACGDCTGDQGDEAPVPTWGLCESECSGLHELACISSASCRAVYMDWCPGADCALQQVFTDCWPTDQSGPLEETPDLPPFNPHCAGLDAQSCSLYSDCSPVHDNSCDQDIELPAAPQDSCIEGDFHRCEPEKVWCWEGDSCGEGFVCNAAEVCETPASCDAEPGLIPCACAGYCVPEPPAEG